MNVRQALEVLLGAVQMLEHRVSALEHGPTPLPRPPANAIEGQERQMLIDALQQSRGIQSHAARRLGISARMMHYKVQIFGLQAYCTLSKRK